MVALLGRKYFRVQVLMRLVAIVATLLLLAYLLHSTTLYASMAIVLLLALLQMWRFVVYVESTNRQFIRFLDSIRYGDSSQHFTPDALSSSFQELSEAFNRVLAEFQRIRTEKEEQYHALQTIVHHVGVVLLLFDNKCNIDLINPAARRLLNVPHLRRLDDMQNHALATRLRSLHTGDKVLVKLVVEDELLQLSAHATAFHMGGRELTLISLQNIVSELEEQEMEAWQRLIRVLTHEIMNSITPISSLSETVNAMLASAEHHNSQLDSQPTPAHSTNAYVQLDHETFQDIRHATQTIHKRSVGLITFVENYRNLTKVPQPDMTRFGAHKLFTNVRDALQPKLSAAGVELRISVKPHTLELTADEKLLEHVFINLVINAIHALEHRPEPRICLAARPSERERERGRVVMTVEDNGAGIVPSALEKIFVPFFTTKPDGSGIGLSLARQILRLHGGTITVHSVPNVGTTFTLKC